VSVMHSASFSDNMSSNQERRRRCFVTGATGFVALNLVDELLRLGWEVYALHRKGSKRARMLTELPNATSHPSQLILVEGDLNVSSSTFSALLPDETDVLYHICHVGENTYHPSRAVAVPGFQPEGAEEHKQLNREAMSNVIHAARARKVRRVVYCSSWSSYGRQPDGTRVDEATPSCSHHPIDSKCCCLGPAPSPVPYFECKLELEEQLRTAVAAEGLNAVILQPCSVFGRYGDTGWCTIFKRLIDSKGRMPGLPGSSSFVDVQDLGTAFVAAADAGDGHGESYIIGGTNASNLEMQQLMAQLVGTPAPQAATPSRLLFALSRWNECVLGLPFLHCLRVKPDTIGSPWLVAKITQDQSTHSNAAQRVLGYHPRPLQDILSRNYEWLVANGDLPLPSQQGAKKCK